MHVAQECLANVSPEQFWSIADNYPDLVKCLHVQSDLQGTLAVTDGVPGCQILKMHSALFAKKT